jgi:hypothetical protein
MPAHGQRVIRHSYLAAVTAYALLLRASANRVYGAALPRLAAAELAVLDAHVLGGVVAEVAPRTIGGVDYLVASCGTGGLDDEALALVSNLSGLHALFACEGDLLRPLPVTPLRRQDDDVVTIQRYAGKTNEALTHLLVNLALAVGPGTFGRAVAGERLRLLDPLCGRGTTLNRAVVYGLDAVGVDHDKRDVEAYEAFFVAWCKDKRLKHKAERARLRKGRPTTARRTTITYGATRDPADGRAVDVIQDDSARVADHLPARSVDALVADLPYGVQHGATGDGALRRTPAALLDAALPAWHTVVRPGAGVALSWNLRTLPRARLVAQLEEHGFEQVRPADDEAFVHRVDRSITRDVVVARRS